MHVVEVRLGQMRIIRLKACLYTVLLTRDVLKMDKKASYWSVTNLVSTNC